MVWMGLEYDPFPLTPALSPKERESHRPRYHTPEVLRFLARRDTNLPLPEGEGWGEGERVRSCNAGCACEA
jgi:hypothetical protein